AADRPERRRVLLRPVQRQQRPARRVLGRPVHRLPERVVQLLWRLEPLERRAPAVLLGYLRAQLRLRPGDLEPLVAAPRPPAPSAPQRVDTLSPNHLPPP